MTKQPSLFLYDDAIFDSEYLTDKEETMTSPVSDAVEDKVKAAIKEQLSKRVGVETTSDIVEKAVKEVKVVKTMDVTLKEGEVFCYDLLKTAKTDRNNFAVKVFGKEIWDKAIAFLIPEQQKDYVFPLNESADILRAWSSDDKTLMYGPTGSGKTSLCQQLCALVGRPFLRVNATGDMDSSMMFGQLTAKEGSTLWVDGSITEAVRYGAILGWDEWELTPPEIAMGMQWLLEDDARLFLKEMPGSSEEKFIKPHEDFHIVCMGNTQGQGDDTGHHAGVNVQNTASIDRFGTVIHLNYLSEEHEKKIIRGRVPSITDKVATMLVKVAGIIRQGYKSNQLSLTMSPRTLIGISKKMDKGLSFADALKLQYINKLSDTQQRVAYELVKKVCGVI